MTVFKCLAVVLATLAVVPADAQAMSKMRLIPGWQIDDTRHMIGVEIVLEPGWKTYWRAPGAGGIPPQFDWSGSRNASAAQVHWPQPSVFETYGVTAIGYHDKVVFPVEIVTGGGAGPTAVTLDLFYGVCDDICIPAEQKASLTLPAPENAAGRAAIEGALARRAATAAEAGVTGLRCDIAPDGKAFALTATVDHAGAVAGTPLAVFESGSDDIAITPVGMVAEGRRIVISATVDHYGTGAFLIDRSRITLTLLGKDRAVELHGCPAG